MIVKENITEFYNTNIDDYYILATKGPDSDNKIERKKELGIPLERHYFNAGLILFNIEKIRSEISEDTLRNYIYENKTKFKYFDQDVLNVLMGDNALYYEEDIYNNQRHFEKDNKISDAQIIHYTSFMKPWKLYYDGYAERYFWYYAGGCGFKGKKIMYTILHPCVKIVYKLYKMVRYR
jgi:lipopolysaccharide biosynthesis glycosyltransferase